MKNKAIILFIVSLLFSVKSNCQDYSLVVSSSVFSNFFNTPESVIDVKSAFNINAAVGLARKTNFGKMYVSFGYTTFNYFTQLDENEFGPTDPPFEDVFDKVKQNGHKFISVPVGVKFYIGNSLYIPVEASSFFELEDESGIFKSYFLSFTTGISYEAQLNDKFYFVFSPIFSVQMNPTESSNIYRTDMPYSCGVRIALGYNL